MLIDPKRFTTLHAALVQAFPTPYALTAMARMHLDVTLDAITKQAGLEERVFDLIIHLEAKGPQAIRALVAGAMAANPTNPQLQAAAALFTDDFDWGGAEYAGAQSAAGDQWDEATWREALQNYYASLYAKVGWVRILGKKQSEPLERLYTDVNVLDRLTAERLHSVDELLASDAPRSYLGNGIERISGDNVLANYNKLYVLGKPGAGKTTFMQFAALRAIQEVDTEKFPIFITLHHLAIDNPALRRGSDIFDYIMRQLAIYDLPAPASFVRQMLKAGRARVLFDGLDEVNVGGRLRGNVIHAIEEFVREYQDSQIIITCRVAATDHSFDGFQYVEMADFDDEQIAAYIDRWFADDAEKADRCWQDLCQQESLKELARVPLLLTLLCLTYQERSSFPQKRSEIYERATLALLEKWDEKRNIERDELYKSLSMYQKQALLASVGWSLFESKQYFVTRTQMVTLIEQFLQAKPGDGEVVLRAIAAQHGLLVERAQGIYAFSHLTLQEYFTARYIVENQTDGSLERLLLHAGEDRWREVILLTCGMVTDATPFIENWLVELAHLTSAQRWLPEILSWANKLASERAGRYHLVAVRAFYLALALDLYHGLDLALDLGLVNPLDLGNDLALAIDFGLVNVRRYGVSRGQEIARTLSYIQEIARETPFVGSVDLCNGLGNLLQSLPDEDSLTTEAARWIAEYEQFLLLKRDLRFWTFSMGSAWKLNNFLEQTRLLVDCLQVASVKDRRAIEDRLLLPPG